MKLVYANKLCIIKVVNFFPLQIDDKYCVKWDKVCDWYASELPESIRETYMKKHKTDIVACDTGCKSGGKK